MKSITVVFAVLLMSLSARAQSNSWNGKKCAVVLTYDDALAVHLDNVIPCLDSAGLKGTFYLIGASPVVNDRLPEWRLAAKNGHELGNHSLTHPCDGRQQGRSWVTAENDLSKFTVARAVNEIRIANTLFKAIDNKTERTFAFPCGDTKMDTVSFYKMLERDFVAARGVRGGMSLLNEVDLNDIKCTTISGQSGDYMVDQAKKAIESRTLLVFLFHGVGGGHNINVSRAAHKQLIQYLKQHEKEIWIAPMVDAAKYIRENKTAKK